MGVIVKLKMQLMQRNIPLTARARPRIAVTKWLTLLSTKSSVGEWMSKAMLNRTTSVI